MASAEYNFTLNQGSNKPKVFILKDGNGVPIPLVGHRLRMHVRANLASNTILWDASTTNGKITTIPLEGRFEVDFHAAGGKITFPWLKAVYDIEWVSPAGEIDRLLHGTISIAREITREVP